MDESSNHPIEFHVPQPFGPLQFKGIILISSNSLASFNLHIHIFVRVLESNVHVQERSNIIRNTIITTIGALIIVGDETSSNKCPKKKTNNYIRVAFLYEWPFLFRWLVCNKSKSTPLSRWYVTNELNFFFMYNLKS